MKIFRSFFLEVLLKCFHFISLLFHFRTIPVNLTLCFSFEIMVGKLDSNLLSEFSAGSGKDSQPSI